MFYFVFRRAEHMWVEDIWKQPVVSCFVLANTAVGLSNLLSQLLLSFFLVWVLHGQFLANKSLCTTITIHYLVMVEWKCAVLCPCWPTKPTLAMSQRLWPLRRTCQIPGQSRQDQLPGLTNWPGWLDWQRWVRFVSAVSQQNFPCSINIGLRADEVVWVTMVF